MFANIMKAGILASSGAAVSTYKIKIWAPGGGSGYWFTAEASGVGGSGSYVEADFAVSYLSGKTLIILPGQGGYRGANATSGPTAGVSSGNAYLNGGESRTQGDGASGGGGGGLCGVFLSSVTFANALVIAGSGGGAGAQGTGQGRGGGGGDQNGDGDTNYRGMKGTTSGGGAASVIKGNGGEASNPGSALTGGRGDRDSYGINRSGGGGGAGYYGGGGGYQGGGGGGASFINGNALSSSITTGTTAESNRTTALPAPNNSDTYYTGTIGEGGVYYNNGGHGRIVILLGDVLVNTYDYTGSTASLVIP
jgi:hypothetical protein